MKPKYWIDCPICHVKMIHGTSKNPDWTDRAIVFVCTLCDTETSIPYVHPKDKGNNAKSNYRRARLEERRIK